MTPHHSPEVEVLEQPLVTYDLHVDIAGQQGVLCKVENR